MANNKKFTVKNGIITPDVNFVNGANTLSAVYQSNGTLLVTGSSTTTLLNVEGGVEFDNVVINGQANVGTNLQVNNTVYIGGASVNSTFYTGTSNNTLHVNGKPEANLNVNAAVFATNTEFAFFANNSNLLDGLDSLYFTNATNISTGTLNPERLAISGVTAGTYGNTTAIPILTVDEKGRITLANTASVDGITGFTYIASNSTFIITSGSGAVDFATITDLNITGEVNANNAYFNYIDLNTGITAPDALEGRLYWDSVHNQLAYHTDNAAVTVNPGFETLLRVKNSSGVAIENGDAVYITGSDINHNPTVDIADASNENKLQVVGLATMDIPDDEYGIITRFGVIDPVDTTGFTAGEKIYLSPVNPGKFVSIAPKYPNYAVRLGNVLEVGSTGSVIVNIQTDVLTTLRVIDDVRIGGDLVVDGDFTVTGNVNSTSVTNLSVEDNFVYLNSGDNIAQTDFTGTGLNDAAFHGVFTGNGTTTYYVRIDQTGPIDSFSWSLDDFATLQDEGIQITGGYQLLGALGISIQFQSTTGHTVGDTWSGTAAPIDIDFGYVGNFNDVNGYQHAGMFRDASDNRFKVFTGYTPEPDAAVNIDTTHESFKLAVLEANTFIGKLQGNADTATNALNANNTTHVNGKTEGNLNVNAAIYATNSQFAFIANNTIHVNNKPEANLNVNSAVFATNAQFAYIANSANFLSGTAAADLAVNSAVYATNAQFAFIANNTIHVNNKPEANLNVNSAVFATNADFAYTANLAIFALNANTLGGTAASDLAVNSAIYATNAQFAYIANNANLLQDYTWASPRAIGTEIANTAKFTDLTTTSLTSNTVNISSAGQLTGNLLTTTSTSQVILSTYPAISFGASKLLVQATSDSNRHVTELLLAANSTHAVATEYGIVHTSAAPLGSYDVDLAGGLVRILVTPASTTSTTFRILQQLFVS
jgi:hypothetical protein